METLSLTQYQNQKSSIKTDWQRSEQTKANFNLPSIYYVVLFAQVVVMAPDLDAVKRGSVRFTEETCFTDMTTVCNLWVLEIAISQNHTQGSGNKIQVSYSCVCIQWATEIQETELDEPLAIYIRALLMFLREETSIQIYLSYVPPETSGGLL